MKINIWIVGLLLFSISCRNNPTVEIQRIEGKLISVSEKIAPDAELEAIIAPYKEKLEAEMNEVLAYTPVNLYKDRNKAETNIGNFMADLCYRRGNTAFEEMTGKKVDFVLLNFGGIRASIPKGNITVRNAYEVMPFENSMVVVELTYDKIQKFLDYYVRAGSAHPISKELSLVYNEKKMISAKLNGKNFTNDRNYYVLTSDYLQGGGDRMDFFKNPVSLTKLDYKIRNAILDEFDELDTIIAKENGRVTRK